MPSRTHLPRPADRLVQGLVQGLAHGPAHRSRRPRRATLAAGVALAAVLAGCGSDDEPAGAGGPSGSGEDVVVLDQAQVDQAVLSPANLGPGFTVDEEDDSDDEDSDGLGCLSGVDDDLGEAAAKAEASYAATTELETPAVSSGVSSFETVEEVTERFERLRTVLADCDRIDVTDDDGATFALEVSHDDETSSDEVADQLNITAVGTAAAEGFELPVSMRLSAARIGNNVVFLSRFDLAAEDGELEPYTEAAIGRLLAVLDGETPAEEPVVADGGTGGAA